MKIQITLEAARRNAGYTQKEAAGILGVHYQTLAAWEQDSSNVPYAEMVKIQGLYHIPTEFIFFGNRNEFIRSIREREAV
ncbi:helix-turn-helix transcriptional regulator [Lacticaseibacillus nasuensis]|uniref:helix-turn-helix transcriptional regulator n=1 Tax=Lacticaseibacillus nasuensis TaxID=944671 RepID=UPI000704BAA8|nr:helix-turn-helix transcriptional regulator [Lacticaseibacillus nasuensis]